MDITNAVVFACTMIRFPALALQLVRQLHPDREPDAIRLLVGREESSPLILTASSTPAEIEQATIEIEKTIALSPSNRGVRFDLCFEDDGVVVVIEMQREIERYIFGRVFYISAVLGAYLLKRGAGFKDMKQVRVTFIYLHDPFGYGDCHNPMEYRLINQPEFNIIGSPRIDIYYVGGKCKKISPDVKELMAYLQSPDSYDVLNTSNGLISQIHNAVATVMKEGMVQRMLMLADVHDMSVYSRGQIEALEKTVINMAKNGLPEETIINCVDLPRETIRTILDNKGASP